MMDSFLKLLKEAMPSGYPEITFTTPEGHQMGLTENQSATYLASGTACLDFFFKVVPCTPDNELVELLEKAWNENPLQTLKLVFQLRGVRGTGKSDKETFYSAAIWLQKMHPLTLRANIAEIAEFGYFKDLLELVLRLVEGPEETKKKKLANRVKKLAKDARSQGGKRVRQSQSEHGDVSVKRMKQRSTTGYYSRKGAAARAAKEAGTLKPREERIAASLEADRIAKEKAAAARKDNRLALARRFQEIYLGDPNFSALYNEVATLFAGCLKEDVKALTEGRLGNISLTGKWAPSLDSSYDLRTHLCSAIARCLFPKEDHPEYEALDNGKYEFAIREKLRKEVLVPLRKALEIPEVFMSAQKWGDVNYRRVPSVAMKNYKEIFLEHDSQRFKQYLADVKAGNMKIASGALLPHEILKGALHDEEEVAEVAELQWKSMVQGLKERGSLNNCLAVCDVSGSMNGTPMEVCIALGILLSELSDEPWKGHVITFSEVPQLHCILGESLKEKHAFTASMNWGMNTDFQLVFDRILEVAQSSNLPPEKMIRRLFVFSDMEFDQASSTSWETDYKAIARKFNSAGYGKPPEIVFWNLRYSSSIPVRGDDSGVALVSGFSKNLVKIFLQEDGIIDPLLVMQTATAGAEYSNLKVVD